VEQIDQGVTLYNADVAIQLVERLREREPAFLEQAVLDLLMAMGYGGAEKQARRLGGSGDGGVDGVIDQDPLGLERVYVQAKRYATDNVVGRETIQAFVGALHGRHASRGIFITTSRFTQHAIEYAATINARVILIDGAGRSGPRCGGGCGQFAMSTKRL
jgi:restriction system protein